MGAIEAVIAQVKPGADPSCGLNLGFHYHVPALGPQGEGIKTSGSQGRFIDSLAERCLNVVCFLHSPLRSELALMDYEIRASNVSLVELGPHVSVPRRALEARHIGRIIEKESAGLDALLIRGPSPLLPTIARAARIPVVLLLVGDYTKGLKHQNQPWWRKQAIRLWVRINHQQERRIARNTMTMVNSSALYEELKPNVPELVEIRTTTLRQADLFIREDTCQAAPYRLLYTGRMEKTKGLLDLIRALALLVGRGTQVELDLVGGSEREAHFIEELSELAGQLQVGERVHHQGYIPFGPELFEYYKKADIFVIPSYAEGFPRSIWEAMAHSLPVVATSVGSIPFYLKDGENATIIPPGEPEKLAQAINELLHSEIKRRAYIRNGLRLAQENVLETQTKLLVETISAYLSRQK